MAEAATAVATPAAPTATDTLSALGIEIAPNVDEVSAETESGDGSEVGADGTGGAATEAVEPAVEAAKADAPVKPSDAAAAKREAFRALFTDEALATPEGVKAAQSALRQAQVKHHDTYQRTVQREQRAKQEISAARQATENYSRLNGQLQNTLSLLQQGTPEQALHALGVLRGKAGIDAYEEMTSTVIGMKKNPPPAESPKVKALEEKLAAIERAEEERRLESGNLAWMQQVAQQAAAAGADGKPANPGIAHFIKAGKFTLRDVVDSVIQDKIEYNQRTGRVLPDSEALTKIEAALADLVPAAPPAAPVATGGAQRLTGRLPGKTVARAGAAAGSRELSEEENMAELAKDPAFLRSLGL
jgi:hypothetical protein